MQDPNTKKMWIFNVVRCQPHGTNPTIEQGSFPDIFDASRRCVEMNEANDGHRYCIEPVCETADAPAEAPPSDDGQGDDLTA